MGIITDNTRSANLAARKRNAKLRKGLADHHGGKPGDYYPSKIWVTMKERGISNLNIPDFLLPKQPSETIPLDSPIFDKPAPKTYKKKELVINKGVDNKAIARQLIELAVKLLGG